MLNLTSYVCRQIPEHGEDQLTTASKLLEHRRQMAEADTALTSQKGVCFYFKFISITIL